jgi:hypothetical protein
MQDFDCQIWPPVSGASAGVAGTVVATASSDAVGAAVDPAAGGGDGGIVVSVGGGGGGTVAVSSADVAGADVTCGAGGAAGLQVVSTSTAKTNVLSIVSVLIESFLISRHGRGRSWLTTHDNKYFLPRRNVHLIIAAVSLRRK